MAMLAVVIGVAMPSLKNFFRSRNLDAEARRFLSLTRYGQSRAVSEGVPMTLWIDVKEGRYGLQTAPGYTDTDGKAVEFAVDKDTSLEVTTPVVAGLARQWQQTALVVGIGTEARRLGNAPTIRFLPDGHLGETSPASVLFRQGETDVIWLVQGTNRLGYEIQTNLPPNLRR